MKKENLHRLEWFFQGRLFDPMTVEKTSAPIEMFTNDNKAVIKERVDFVCKRALTDAHDKLPSQISGGMQKRAGYCYSVIVNRSPVL
jgi:phospholipid/cholesterol/gamma-HCH transport system ATP-binding protein